MQTQPGNNRAQAPYPPIDGTEPCARTDPEAWFPNPGDAARAARRLCAGRHVLDACREWAVYATAGDRYVLGIWGGTTGGWRQEERRRRLQARRGLAA